MSGRDLIELVLLGALWGASFLFMRIAAPDFGPIALVLLRVGIAALFLLPWLMWRRRLTLLRAHWPALLALGVFAVALPFVLFAYALLSIGAGFGSILNAVTPMFTAVVAFAWLGERLSPLKIAGLVLGFLGVVLLVWNGALFEPGGTGLAVLAALAAALCYGIGANYTRQRLAGVDPMAVSVGTQLAAALLLLPPALWWWPAQSPGLGAWLGVAALGVLCTGVAFVLFFRLIAGIGAARATTVTYLIPVFGMLWGALFLRESVSPRMLAGCAVILLGTALATGILARRRPARGR